MVGKGSLPIYLCEGLWVFEIKKLELTKAFESTKPAKLSQSSEPLVERSPLKQTFPPTAHLAQLTTSLFSPTGPTHLSVESWNTNYAKKLWLPVKAILLFYFFTARYHASIYNMPLVSNANALDIPVICLR